MGSCASANIGTVGDIGTVLPLGFLVVSVHSNLVIEFDAYLNKLIKHIWEIVIVRKGRVQFSVESLPKERNLGSLI